MMDGQPQQRISTDGWPDQNKDEQSHWLHNVPQNIFAGCWIYVFPMRKIYRRWVFSHLGLAAVPQEAALDPNMRVGGTVNGHGIRHGLDVGYGMWQWFSDFPQLIPLQIAMKPWLGSICYGNYSMWLVYRLQWTFNSHCTLLCNPFKLRSLRRYGSRPSWRSARLRRK